jgi:excisionase family DNA binding protein
MKDRTLHSQETEGAFHSLGKSNDETFNHSGLLTKKQVAEALSVTERTISKWQKKGYLPVIKIGGRCLFPWAAVQDKLRREFGRNFR